MSTARLSFLAIDWSRTNQFGVRYVRTYVQEHDKTREKCHAQSDALRRLV